MKSNIKSYNEKDKDDYDMSIYNDGTIENLEKSVYNIVNDIRRKKKWDQEQVD